MGLLRRLPWILAVAAALAIAGCGSDGSVSGDTLPIYGVPGGGGDKLSELYPQVIKPPIENFRDNSSLSDPATTRWVKNCYDTLPPLNSGSEVYQNTSLEAWADSIFAGINANRASEGRPLLKRNRYLDALAQAHARDMALRDFFGHVNPEQMTGLDRLNAIDPPKFSYIGETAAKGQESPKEVTDGWYNSEKHYKISMDPIYQYAGVGVYCDVTDTTMPMHFIMDFVQFVDDPETYDGWLKPGVGPTAQ